MKNLLLLAGAYLLLICPIYAQGNYKVCFACDIMDYNKNYASTLRRALEQALADCGKNLIYNPDKGTAPDISIMNVEDRELIKLLENSLKDRNDPIGDKKIAKDYPGVDFFAITKLIYTHRGDPFQIDCSIISQKRVLTPLLTFSLNESEINAPHLVKDKFVHSLKMANMCSTKTIEPVDELQQQLTRLIQLEFLVPNDQEVKLTLAEIRNDEKYLKYLELKLNFLVNKLLEQLRNSPLACKETLRLFELLDLLFIEIAQKNPVQLQRVKSLKDFIKTQHQDVINKCK